MKKSTFILLIVITFSCAIKKEDHLDIDSTYKQEGSFITENKQIGIADTTVSFLSGKIIEYRTNKPIQFCKVVLTNIKTNENIGGITDNNGKFSFVAIADKYYIRIIHIDYLTFRDTIKLGIGEMRQVNVTILHKKG